MVRLLTPGDFDRRAQFYSSQELDDGRGNKVTGEPVERFTLWANLKYLRGGEEVLASRLEGRQPILMTVWTSALSRQIRADWQCNIAGQPYSIAEPPRPSQGGQVLEFLIVSSSTHG